MMEDITIGLDFGTHQSKVCFEDASDPRNREYSFMEFSNNKGKKTLFLPSIVQINNDKTVSYGFVDEKNALVLGKVHSFDEPQLVLPNEPVLKQWPEQPRPVPVKSLESYIAAIPRKEIYPRGRRKKNNKKKTVLSIPYHIAVEQYEVYKEETERKNHIEYFRWKHLCTQVDQENARILERHKKECQKAEEDFKAKHNYWARSVVNKKALYRYFKIATFSEDYEWTESISPKIISTWYIAYILFCIFEKYPDNTPIQMGIPESIGDEYADIQKANAEDVFYTAYLLYKRFGSLEKYLKASYEELLSLTDFTQYKKGSFKDGSQILVLPEAFAGLLTIAQQGKLGIGMTLLVDIGGGSTDISLFNVISHRNGAIPNVSRIISLHKGLNYIYALYRKEHYNMTIEEIRSLFVKSPEEFTDVIEQFRKELVEIVQDEIYYPLYMAALKRGIGKERIMPILSARPVVYSGGGGIYEEFHKRIHVFTEPVSVSKELLSLKNISNKRLTDEELSILAVAYGLSIPQFKEPEMIPLENLFDSIQLVNERQRPSSYEHGMSDVE